jgi:hypothetical protein
VVFAEEDAGWHVRPKSKNNEKTNDALRGDRAMRRDTK